MQYGQIDDGKMPLTLFTAKSPSGNTSYRLVVWGDRLFIARDHVRKTGDIGMVESYPRQRALHWLKPQEDELKARCRYFAKLCRLVVDG